MFACSLVLFVFLRRAMELPFNAVKLLIFVEFLPHVERLKETSASSVEYTCVNVFLCVFVRV